MSSVGGRCQPPAAAECVGFAMGAREESCRQCLLELLGRRDGCQGGGYAAREIRTPVGLEAC